MSDMNHSRNNLYRRILPGKSWAGRLGCAASLQQSPETIQGHALDTTNNRMELNAAIDPFNIKKAHHVALYTDSQYLRLGMTQWLSQWQKNNWRGSGKKAIKNKDLWEKLAALSITNSMALSQSMLGTKKMKVDQLAWQAAQKAKGQRES